MNQINEIPYTQDVPYTSTTSVIRSVGGLIKISPE